VIGAGPAYTDRRGAAASSYLLLADGAALLLDLGQGAFSNLSAHVEPSALTAVLISHLHPDHFVDLVPLRHYLKWEFDPPRRAQVIGPAGLADRLDGLDGQPGFSAVSLDTQDLAEGVIRVGPFEVEARRVTHTENSYAFRVTCGSGAGSGGNAAGSGGNAAGSGGNAAGSSQSGPGIVYSGDCSCADDLLPLIHPGDTLLCEASFGAGPVAPGAQHITAADAAQAASVGSASRLLLTHVLSGHSRAEIVDAASSVFEGPVQLVTEGDRFVV